jgi:tetratricopeptide (TPR) repeat protein
MPRRHAHSPAELPQRPETWGLGVFQLRFWVGNSDEQPRRPWTVMILDLDNDVLLTPDLLDHSPDPDEIHAALYKVMNKPPKGAGRPRRPARLLCSDPDLTAGLAPALAQLGIACDTRPLPMLPEIVKDLEATLRRGEPENPGLLSMEGVTPELAGGVFAAATEFYRQAPWIHVLNEQAFRLRVPVDGGRERIAVVMGNAGVEYGLAVYNDWADVETIYLGVDDPAEAVPQHGGMAMFYETIDHLPFDDVDALEHYHWAVAGEQAFPVPILVSRDIERRMQRPEAQDLVWLEAALLAIPGLVNDHLVSDGQGDYRPFETQLTVATRAGPATVFAKYPAGVIPRDQRPLHQPDLDWPGEEGKEREKDGAAEELPVFDRRMMEGEMAKLVAQIPGAKPAGDKKLQKAQALMYTAWETDNPARRISLAHRALSISPDCADAYVLLAEEEADTTARALALYEKSMAAGEHALGPGYFKHEAGRFWGILETRPYMRARQGVADCLWKLNRRDEALGHYRDLLRLNAEDNQGIRYLAALLLLDMERDGQVLKLLKQFKEDTSAAWLYTWALVLFRQNGASAVADRRLKKALKLNKFVPAYLLGHKRVPNRLPDYMGLGDDAEAAHYAGDYLNHWRRTPGAVKWLESQL